MIMPVQGRRPRARIIGAACGLAFVAACAAAYAQSGPFAMLGGAWAGTGTIKLTEGGSERIRCKATYDLVSGSSVRLNLTCASDSYKFVLLGSMDANGSAVTGNWTEQIRNVAGAVSGSVSGNHISVKTSGALNATLSLTASGGTQSILLKSEGTSIQQMSISMKRT